MARKRITRSIVVNKKDAMDETKKDQALKIPKAKKLAIKPCRKESNTRKKMLEYKREYIRAKREKIRADPVEYENYCSNERKRYYQRKAEGKIKTIKELTVKEQRAKRKYERERKQQYRAKKKQQVVEYEEPPSKQKLVSVKKSLKDRRKYQSKILQLKNQNLLLTTALSRMTKKVQKLRLAQAKYTDLITLNAVKIAPSEQINDRLSESKC